MYYKFLISLIFILLARLSISAPVIPQKEASQREKSESQKTIDFLKAQGPKFAPSADKEDQIKQLIGYGNNALKLLYLGKLSLPSGEGGWAPRYKVEDYSKIQNAYMNNIVAMSWALFNKAVSKNNGFTGGAIVIEDKDKKLFNFLLNYVKGLNANVAAGINKIEYVSNNPYAYQRTSTHFKEIQDKAGYEQYGIEIRYMGSKGEVGPLAKLLPTNKVHLVFGNVTFNDHPLTFIKWEDHGLYGTVEAIKHLHGVFKSKENEIGRREKVSANLNNIFSNLIDILENIRPQLAVLAKSQRVIDGRNKLYPIRTMNLILDKIKDILPAPELPGYDISKNVIINKIKQDANKLNEALKNYDHMDLRRGDEVILDQNEISL